MLVVHKVITRLKQNFSCQVDDQITTGYHYNYTSYIPGQHRTPSSLDRFVLYEHLIII